MNATRKAITTGPASKRKTRTKTTPFDVAAYLRTTEDIAAYLDAWLTEVPAHGQALRPV